MRLENDSLVLRSARPADAQILTDWWNDGKVMAHAGFPLGLHTTQAETAALISRQSSRSRLLILEWDGRPIGECSYRVDGSTAEIGIKICDFEMQNRGIGRRALKMLISTLFTLTDSAGNRLVEKIVLDTNTKNLRARHVYESLGFRLLEIRENSWQDQLGEWQSAALYELERQADS
jgi:RimJ/RimL family protein N-acetyltransferase